MKNRSKEKFCKEKQFNDGSGSGSGSVQIASVLEVRILFERRRAEFSVFLGKFEMKMKVNVIRNVLAGIHLPTPDVSKH